jgi:hypothetical protein
VIGDQGMVKRDARTSPSSRYSFGTRPSQRNRLTARWAHRLESLCSDQPRPACRGTRTFLLCAKRAFPPFPPRSNASAPCFGAEIRSGLELCDVSRSTNTGLPPTLRHRCRSLRRAMTPLVMERKTDEIHRLRHKPHRAVARGPRKVPSVLSMPYGQRRDTTAPRGWHIPIRARACA